ncbi:MAG: LuxR C-terminal-related transcriptional regulator [Panacagrimonas sp.]
MLAKTQPWEIQRTRLRFPGALDPHTANVVSISAAAGYGKTTLLSHWTEAAERKGCKVIRLNGSKGDKDGDRLLLDLAASLNSNAIQSPEALLDSYGISGRLALVKSLYAEMQSGAKTSALVIDDVQELMGESAESVLRLLVDHQPPSITLILSGRTALHALLNKALFEGRLIRFTEQQLALSEEEIAHVLQQHGIKARQPLVQRLRQRTQGWPAAVRLVALTLKEDELAQDRFVDGLASGPQPLTDYLNEVLLANESPEIYSFLMRISLLRTIPVKLAQVVSGRDDAWQVLEDVRRRALPIRQLDGTDPRYALHPLVRNFLLARYKHAEPKDLRACRDRSIQHLVREKQIEPAIELCLDCDDVQGAASLISEHAADMVQRYGRHSAYLYWVNQLPPEALERFPEIRLKQAWSLNFLHRFDEAEAIRKELETRLASFEQAGSVSVEYLRQAIESQRCAAAGLQDFGGTSINISRRLLSQWPDADAYNKAIAHIVLAFAERTKGHLDTGVKHAHIGQAFGRECQGYYISAWAAMVLLTNLIKQGDLRRALLECDQCIDELAPHLGARAPALMMLQAMRSSVTYEFGRLTETAEALGDGLTALVDQSTADPIIMAYVTLARLQACQDKGLEALETLYEGEVLGRSRRLPRVAITLCAERVVMLLRQGELSQAKRQWGELEADLRSGVFGQYGKAVEDKRGRIQVRFCLLENSHLEAIRIIDKSLEHARRTGQRRKQTELLLLMALAWKQASEADRSRQALDEAIGLGMAGGYCRTFLDEGEPIRQMLEQRLAQTGDNSLSALTTRHLQQMLAQAGPQPSAAEGKIDNRHQQNLIEPLTNREIEIVRRLRAGPTNKQLSEALFITPGTLKWHLGNIYGKLGVDNRLAATSRALELGLIQP